MKYFSCGVVVGEAMPLLEQGGPPAGLAAAVGFSPDSLSTNFTPTSKRISAGSPLGASQIYPNIVSSCPLPGPPFQGPGHSSHFFKLQKTKESPDERQSLFVDGGNDCLRGPNSNSKHGPNPRP